MKERFDQDGHQLDVETEHSYDGIKEYDNPLPGWWKNLFVLSVIFSVFYWVYFHGGTEGRTIQDEYDRHLAVVVEKQFGEINDLKGTREEILDFALTHDDKDKWLKVGQSVYKVNCQSCHGGAGEGGTGPNLTDDFWKNVTSPEDILKVIENGAAGGAMPAWKGRLGHRNKVILTAAYIASLRGSKPAGGKASEGPKVAPWESFQTK